MNYVRKTNQQTNKNIFRVKNLDLSFTEKEVFWYIPSKLSYPILPWFLYILQFFFSYRNFQRKICFFYCPKWVLLTMLSKPILIILLRVSEPSIIPFFLNFYPLIHQYGFLSSYNQIAHIVGKTFLKFWVLF